jgi:hypothetical protein
VSERPACYHVRDGAARLWVCERCSRLLGELDATVESVALPTRALTRAYGERVIVCCECGARWSVEVVTAGEAGPSRH